MNLFNLGNRIESLYYKTVRELERKPQKENNTQVQQIILGNKYIQSQKW